MFWLRNRYPVREERTSQRRTRGATAAVTQGPSLTRLFLSLAVEGLRRVPWPQVSLGLVVALAAGLAPWGISQGLGAIDRQFDRITVEGDLNRLDRDNLTGVLEPWLGQSFYATDLARVKTYIEQHPWIESAAISRSWPDTLTVEVIEQAPVAYWNGNALINPDGQIFRPREPTLAGAVPEFRGPAGMAQTVLERAGDWSAQLATVGLGIAGIELETRGAWTLQLDNGIAVSLGRDRIDERFERFMAVYRSHLAPIAAAVQAVDARYDNGIAVEWRGTPTDSIASRGDGT